LRLGERREVGVNPEQTQAFGRAIGLVAAVLSFGIPAALWFVALRPWKPRSRTSYAVKCALWPVVVLTYFFGGPVAYAIVGLPRTYLPDFGETVIGLIIPACFLSMLCFGIGWIRGAAKQWVVASSSQRK
jgi:hypothetical protein